MELGFSIDKRSVQEIIEKHKMSATEMISEDMNTRDWINQMSVKFD